MAKCHIDARNSLPSVGCDAKDLWDTLHVQFYQVSKSKVMQLRRELVKCNRGSSNISEYFNKVKSICDELAAIGEIISDEDKAMYLLFGLGDEYNVFVASVMAKPPTPSFNELRPLLLQHEAMFKAEKGKTKKEATDVEVLNVSSPNGNNFRGRGRGRGNRGRGRNFCGRGNATGQPYGSFQAPNHT